MKKVVLIDSHAIIHRAFHALPLLTATGGEPVNAVYGFASILLRILKELKPDYLAATFDMPGKTFRHEQYEEYKAHRPPAPEDLKSQFAKVHELVEAFGIPVFQKEGYEADDMIGTLATRFAGIKDCEVIIVTGDSDALQLVRPNVKVYTMKKGVNDIAVYGPDEVRERYGLEPEQLIDFKGLKGDASDNIKGVKGIGEKTAVDLLQKFGSIEGIYKALGKKTSGISEVVANKLREGREDAQFSRELARIRTDAPIEARIEDITWRDGSHHEQIAALFAKYGFHSLLKRLSNNGFSAVVGHAADSEGEKKKTSRRSEGKQEKTDEEPLVRQASLLDVSGQEVAAGLAAITRKELAAMGTQVGILLCPQGLALVDRTQLTPRIIPDVLLRNARVRTFFGESKRAFFVHDAKSVIRFLRERGVKIANITFDTMLAAYLCDSSGRDFSYAACASRALMCAPDNNTSEGLGRFFEVADILERELAQKQMTQILRDIELPVARVLADMEENGILLDTGFLAKLGKEVDAKISALTKTIYDAAGRQFNINSSQQLSHILFEVLQIATGGLRKTAKNRVISTRESELEKLRPAHPIIRQVLDYRELAKLKSTYIEALPKLVDATSMRLHTTFNQTGTSTGRLSSSNPNLQNIPVLSSYGREVRKAFIAQPGFLLVSFDYSQIELRVAAHLARDEKMIDAFQKGMDIHTMTAAVVYHVASGQVTPELRRSAKVLNFGVLYGMGPPALAQATDMSRAEAQQFISEYFKDFSGIRRYLEQTKEFAAEHGYVQTLFGRRRYIPEINSSNWQIKREAERMAINHPIQGTATGDIIKLAMIRVAAMLEQERLAEDARLLLQVHDELVCEIAEKRAGVIVPEIKRHMEQVVELLVPLVVDAKAGYNWGEQGKFGQN